MFHKVAPMKGVMRFERKDKSSPRYMGPFEILERVGIIAYMVALSPQLSTMHDIFCIFMLRTYVSDPLHVLD